MTTEFNGLMRIPRSKEAQHIMLMGDTGAGKSTLILQLLRQIRDRGELAIINDPGGEFLSRFYDEGHGDYVLNPLDARMPFWSPAMELTRNEEALTIANSLYQPTSANSSDNKEFFFRTAAQIFAELLKDGPTTQELVERIADENGLQERFQGTEKEYYVRRSASNQATGVLSTLGLVADTLRLLPSRDNTTRTWNATDWTKNRRGWIFITYEEKHTDVLLPLISLWIDILVMRLLHSPQPGQKKVWFAIDELASLQRLPQLHTALTKSRKSKNPLIIGLQGRSQVEDIYGKVAEVMLSQAATKVFLRTTEPKSALWISDTIGKVEIERLRETRYDGNRNGHNFTVDRQIEPLVMDSEINGLADLHAFLKLDNSVTRFQFPVMEMPVLAEKFIERHSPESALRFERESLTRHPQVASRSKEGAPKASSSWPTDAQQVLPFIHSQDPLAKHAKPLPTDPSNQSGKQDELVTI